ncbi:unnamed protein product [Rotaria socialis]|uniref:Fatty acid desaturase domain-containing protein n=1 Tax=Rotaria socialis TaxID=392032 RepID=A0A817XAI9_9BILA|nr:unnamed protein product [Rotaria socialis]
MAANFPKQNRSIHILSASREICRTIKQSDAEIRQKYPFLYHQDVICAIIFAAIWTVMLIALVLSLLHELEHDIIHNLYFKSHRWIQNCMFIVIWVAKLHVSPWYRRQLHLKHHLLSGQINDAEERLIGLGLSPNYKRMAVSVHPFGGLLISDDINYDINTLIGFHTCYPIIRTLAVCLCFPNVLRQGCLVMMSNSSHYYGDIPLNTVYYQNQILDSWFLFPFQLFCFNFGATRIVHHYVPSQPFYIRHFTAKSVKHTMVKEQLLKRNIKRRHTTTNNSELKTNEKVMDANGSTMNDDMQKLNAFVNQIALYDVSADQIEEVNTKAS